jgi:phosphoribosyl-ATP pyrophosphohydrolase/phosphoribosyl-AMP cyclohydrolase
MNTLNPDQLDWEKGDGLLPVIVQDAKSGRVLMLGYMNRDALQATQKSGDVTFFSRSKNRLWTKGESSGNRLRCQSMSTDCDSDSLLVLANPLGPTCHLGTTSCFQQPAINNWECLPSLATTITDRAERTPEGSYTVELLQSGIKRVAQKVGEEAVETVIAALNGPDEELINESADLLFHWLVLLQLRGVALEDIHTTLSKRAG